MNITSEEKVKLIAQVSEYNRRLANWLKSDNVPLDQQEYRYGTAILDHESGNGPPKVGIVTKGVVEIQGEIPRPPGTNERIIYPYALRYPGELIGEVEFLYHQLEKETLQGRTWTAHANANIYFTPLDDTKETYFKALKQWLRHNGNKEYRVKVAWFDPQKMTDEGIVALTETAFKRLSSLISFWQPHPDEIYDIATEKGEMPIYLFQELVRAIQGARIAFRPFTSQEMASFTPWNDNVLSEVLKGKQFEGFGFGDCVVLGIHTPIKPNSPFILLPHFYLAPIADPSRACKIPEIVKMKGYLDSVIKIATAYGNQHNSLIPNYKHTNRPIIALRSETSTKRNVLSSGGCDEMGLIRILAETINVNPAKLASVADLSKLGLLGSASLIVLPHRKQPHVTS